MSATDALMELENQIEESSNIEQVLAHVRASDILGSSKPLSSDDYDVLLNIFRGLQEWTASDYTHGRQLIFDYLLAYFQHGEDVSEDARVPLHFMRELLVKWIDQYPESERGILRDDVLTVLAEGLQSPDSESVCWTIQTVGFRRTDIENLLWSLGKLIDSQRGDTALAVLVNLGVPQTQQSDILQILHRRITHRQNSSLTSALERLASPTSIPVIRDHLLGTSKDYLSTALALNVLDEIADRWYQDRGVQESVWEILVDRYEGKQNRSLGDLFSGYLVAACNTRLVVPQITSWLADTGIAGPAHAHYRYILGHRLTRCVRPEQLLGWRDIVPAQVISALQQDALQNTGFAGGFQTAESLHKEMAWNVLLLAGVGEVLTSDWYQDAVESEVSPFVKGHLFNLLSSFQLGVLPEHVLNLVREPFDPEEMGDNGEVYMRRNAIGVVRSAADEEAFAALLDFGLTMRKSALVLSGEALSDVARWRLQHGDEKVVPSLVNVVKTSPNDAQRMAAARALLDLSEERLLEASYADQLAPLVLDHTRGDYEQFLLIGILGLLGSRGWKAPADLYSHLAQLAQNQKSWAGFGSLMALADNGLLLDHTELLTSRLSLQQEADTWHSHGGKLEDRWALHAISVLFKHQPSRFMPAVASLLISEEWTDIIPLLGSIREMYGQDQMTPLPEPLARALIDRVHQQGSFFYSESDLFWLFSEIAPVLLVTEPWHKTWDSWTPDRRAILADALGAAHFTSEKQIELAAYLLVLLARDGQYRVRRSAFRALAALSPKRLELLCRSWLATPFAQLRERAALAYAWIPNDELSSTTFEQLSQQVAQDPELAIREAGERERIARRKRLWAGSYLVNLWTQDEMSQEQILDKWPYAQAIIQLGDDSTIRQMAEIRRNKNFAPNIRAWISRIVEETDKNWKKVVGKWPKPQPSWQGNVYVGNAEFSYETGTPQFLSCATWEIHSESSIDQPEWEGLFWSEGPSYIPATLLKVRFPYGGNGMVTITATASEQNLVRFRGVGPHPQIDLQLD